MAVIDQAQANGLFERIFQPLVGELNRIGEQEDPQLILSEMAHLYMVLYIMGQVGERTLEQMCESVPREEYVLTRAELQAKAQPLLEQCFKMIDESFVPATPPANDDNPGS